MLQSIRIAPSNSMIAIMDRVAKDVDIPVDVPEFQAGRRIWRTPTCLVVGTLYEADGKTLVSFSDEEPSATVGPLLFDGIQTVPTRQLAVCELATPLLFVDVPAAQTRVRVWTNDRSEPDQIQIVVG